MITYVDHLDVNGKHVAVPGLRRIWPLPATLHLPATCFYGPDASRKPLRVVWHYDVAPSLEAAANGLRNPPPGKPQLSYTLGIDEAGRVVQFCDLDLRLIAAKHTKAMNPGSIGVVLNTPVDPAKDDPTSPRPRVRVGTGATAEGLMLGYHRAQLVAAGIVGRALSDILGVPMVLPAAVEGGTSVALRKLADPRREAYRGHGGHYHFDAAGGKSDPGAQLWPSLRAAGFGVA